MLVDTTVLVAAASAGGGGKPPTFFESLMGSFCIILSLVLGLLILLCGYLAIGTFIYWNFERSQMDVTSETKNRIHKVLCLDETLPIHVYNNNKPPIVEHRVINVGKEWIEKDMAKTNSERSSGESE